MKKELKRTIRQKLKNVKKRSTATLIILGVKTKNKKKILNKPMRKQVTTTKIFHKISEKVKESKMKYNLSMEETEKKIKGKILQISVKGLNNP